MLRWHDSVDGPGRNAQIPRAQVRFVRQLSCWLTGDREAGSQGHLDQNITHFIMETGEQAVFGAIAKMPPIGGTQHRMESAIAILGADGNDRRLPAQR